jgi:hypothetical protein
MSRFIFPIAVIFFISFVHVNAQYNSGRFGFSANYIYTTTAKYFPYPNSADFTEESYSLDKENLESYSFEVRYGISNSIFLGLSAEYFSVKYNNLVKALIGQNYEDASAVDKFTVMPFELTLYYVLPFSGEQFKFLMEGGAAYYYGTFDRELGTAKISSSVDGITYGIHTGVSIDYLITDYLALTFAMKFRDPEIEMNNTYQSQNIMINNREVVIPRDRFSTKINIDGVAFSFGLSAQL